MGGGGIQKYRKLVDIQLTGLRQVNLVLDCVCIFVATGKTSDTGNAYENMEFHRWENQHNYSAVSTPPGQSAPPGPSALRRAYL